MHPSVQIGLVQFSERFQWHQFLPYSVGLLQAYAQRHLKEPARFAFAPLIFLPEPIEKLAQGMQALQIVGFSVYIWNIKRSLALAQLLKLQNPSILIVFGGPHVPDHAEAFLREHPFIDLCCHGAGEAVFTAILEAFPENDWSAIAGVSYFNFRGQFVHQPPLPRSRDLSQIPSPYTQGVFLPLLKAHPQTRWIATWETNRGCPFSCTYCDWGSAIASKLGLFDMEQLCEDLEWFGTYQIDMIFCADANFGILKRDLDLARYLAKVYQRYRYPHTFHQQTAKNSPERTWELHQILAQAGIFAEVTLSLQSMNAHTLKQIKRDNISLLTFLNLQKRFQMAGIATYTDMILGLPGETYASFVRGVEQVVQSGQHSRIQFYNAFVLPNAEMALPEYRKQHGIETVWVSLFPDRFNADDFVEGGEMVIATCSMPRSDWLRARVFAWMCKFLYYLDKPLQIPLLLLYRCAGISFVDLIEAFLAPDSEKYPLLSDNFTFFQNKALDLQAGKNEATWVPHPCLAEQGGSLGAEHFLLYRLSRDNQLNAFYHEAERLLLSLLNQSGSDFSPAFVSEAVALNAALLKTNFLTQPGDLAMPFHAETLEVVLSHNLPEVYQALLADKPWQWRPEPQIFSKSWSGPPFLLEHRFLQDRLASL